MNNYKRILNELTGGYAYHQVIYEDGIPVDYRYIDHNSEFIKITGFPENINGKTIREIAPGIENDSKDWIGVFGKLASEGGIIEFENYSENLKAWYKIKAFSDGDGYFDVLFTDNTVVKQSGEKLEKAEEIAKDAIGVKNDFLANMSHELRTPLNGIIGMANLLGDSDLDSDQCEFLSMLMDSADNLLVLITDVLDFSRIENSELEIHKIDFNIRELVDITIGNLSKHAAGKGLSLNYKYHIDNRDIINGDKVRIGQILVNLVTNAIKFTQQGSVDVDIEKSDSQLRIIVHDSGIGISREECSNIFTSFRQIESTYTKTQQGVGLGLSIVKSLLDLMEGSISVESEPDKGSTFTVIIPIGDVTAEKRKVQEKIITSTGLRKILVVEDEAINRIYMVCLLNKAGWNIIEAEDGIEAVKKYQQEKPDFIIMDVGLPGLDGISATKIIREAEAAETGNYRAYIIALTAHAFDEDIENCMNAGMDDYLSKPVSAKNLLDLIENSTV